MKFLIVDDSRAMRMIVRKTLRQAGYGSAEYLEADGGKAALEIARAEQPDVVFTDWNMPEVNGYDVLQGLRAANLSCRRGVVTSAITPEIKSQATLSGAEFFIAKPFTADSFRNALEEIGVRGVGAFKARSNMPQVAPLQMDVPSLKRALSGAISRDLDIGKGKLDTSRGPFAIAHYGASAEEIGAVVIMQIEPALGLAAALSLLPPAGVKEALRTGQVGDALRDNLNEVFNIMSQVVSTAEAPVRLQRVEVPVARIPLTLKRAARKGERADARVGVTGYGAGQLAMVRLEATPA